MQRAADSTELSGDESDASDCREKVLSKRTFETKNAWALEELLPFFATGPTDPACKSSHFICLNCGCDFSVLLQGYYEISSHYQGKNNFARDQRLGSETPNGWF